MFIGLSLPVALTACPGGGVLEDPDRFTGVAGTAGAGGAGSGTGGTAGTAGAAGTAGTAGTGGSAGGGYTYVPPVCDWQTPLAAQCARVGCHNTSFKAADLDLQAADVHLRLINQNAAHGDITCPNPDGGVLKVPCVPATCPTAMLVDTTNPANSWMLKKLVGTDLAECGAAMPIAPGTVTAEQKDCLIQWVNAMAAATPL